jgi:hypothetical protein
MRLSVYQYRITKLVRIVNSDTLTAVIDLGFNTTTEVTFKVARITEPDLDLDSDVDPAVELRRAIIKWFKTAPKPWTVQMYREGGQYKGDVLDNNGNLLNDEILKRRAPSADEPQPQQLSEYDTQVIHGLPIAGTDPAAF